MILNTRGSRQGTTQFELPLHNETKRYKASLYFTQQCLTPADQAYRQTLASIARYTTLASFTYGGVRLK